MKADKSNKRENKTSGKKKQKRIPFRMLLVLLILIAASALMMLIRTGFNLNIGDFFVKTETIASSEAILKQVKEISRLDSIEFIYKTVFPYDLIDKNIDLKSVIKRYRAGEKLSFGEIEALSVYGISHEANIDLLSDSYDFAVINTHIKAGWKFTGDSDDIVKVNTENNTVEIKMPAAEITEIIVEDADSSIYDYPDLKISPEQWKTLTSIISRRVRTEAEQRGILSKAEERGSELISRLLKSSGFNEVIFIK